MKIELHINDTTWGLFVDNLKIANGLVEHEVKPRTYAINARTGETAYAEDGKVSNPKWTGSDSKPRWLTPKQAQEWIIRTQTPAEVAADLADSIATEALSIIQDRAIAEEQERRRRLVAGGGMIAG